MYKKCLFFASLRNDNNNNLFSNFLNIFALIMWHVAQICEYDKTRKKAGEAIDTRCHQTVSVIKNGITKMYSKWAKYFRVKYVVCMYIRWFRRFLDFKVSRYCESFSFLSVWGPWNFKRKVLKYSRNCSLHNTLIPNVMKPLNCTYRERKCIDHE